MLGRMQNVPGELKFPSPVYAKLEDFRMRTLLLVLLILLIIGALPLWPYSANWGYYPGGGLGLVLIIVLLLVVLRR